MPQKSYLDGFDKIAIIMLPYISQPNISEDIQQTLGRLLAFDKTNELFRLVQVTESGGLIVSNFGDKASNVTINQIVPFTDTQLLAGANPNRYRLVLRNVGVNTLILNYSSSSPVGSNTLYMYPDDVVDLSDYLGNVYGHGQSAGQQVAVYELTRDDMNYSV